MFSLESSSNQSTQSVRSHESSDPSSKNVLPNLHDALKFEKLKPVIQQFLVRLNQIQSKEKSQYKAVRMILAFMAARKFFQDDDVKILHRHFLKVYAQKIEGQLKKLEKAKKSREGFHLRNIYILQTFADYIRQMLQAPLVSEEFLHRMLSFIFRLKEVKGGIEGRKDVQERKIRKSLEYLKRTFSFQGEVGTQTENEETAGKAILEEQKEAHEEEVFKGELEGEQFVGTSMLEIKDPHYQKMSIFLEQEQDKEIKYGTQLCKAQLKKI